MSNVVAFERIVVSKPVDQTARAPKSMTLFIHIKRATLIAHCANLQSTGDTAAERVGKSRV